MEKKKLYEIEIMRTGVTPREFFSYCKREFLRRCPGESMDNWMDDFREFCAPSAEFNSHNRYDDGSYEICKAKPYDWQLFYSGAYNFIMEFNFDDDKRGWGYLYCIEYKR